MKKICAKSSRAPSDNSSSEEIFGNSDRTRILYSEIQLNVIILNPKSK